MSDDYSDPEGKVYMYFDKMNCQLKEISEMNDNVIRSVLARMTELEERITKLETIISSGTHTIEEENK